jgi:hypothetical protein
VEALERQEPFVNPTLANHALALLSKLFRHGSIEHHGAFVNVAASRVQPLIADPRSGVHCAGEVDTGRAIGLQPDPLFRASCPSSGYA